MDGHLHTARSAYSCGSFVSLERVRQGPHPEGLPACISPRLPRGRKYSRCRRAAFSPGTGKDSYEQDIPNRLRVYVLSKQSAAFFFLVPNSIQSFCLLAASLLHHNYDVFGHIQETV